MTIPDSAKSLMAGCRTLMLDMDGTLLDLAFDNYVWKQLVPQRYAERHGIDVDEARNYLFSRYGNVQGDLKWYCLDHWSEELGMDLLHLHRDVDHRIGYLPGARAFLETMHAHHIRVVMVTNSHPDTLMLKDEVTGLTRYFDAVYSSHHFGQPKERPAFWHALREEESFDPASSVMVDDTHSVLASARDYGIAGVVAIMRPDSSEPRREQGDFVGVDGVSDLLS
ncbi:MAG: GMP/IMP nucleotidase [Pseudomonadota bacterium]